MRAFKDTFSRLFFAFLFLALFVLAGSLFPGGVSSEEPVGEFYYQIEINTAINPITADYLERALEVAEADGALGLIIKLDTPGGLMESLSRMNSAILNTDVPVIVWVGPAGARAASAGAFLTYAAHVSAMSPGTRIGAAHPVAGMGDDLEGERKEKVVSDAVAQIRSLARRHDRNETYAEKFVRGSLAIGHEEAIENNVVDYLADSVENLIEQLESRQLVIREDHEVKLVAAPVVEIEPTWRENFFGVLLNPNLVFIFLTLGIYGLIYEFSNPGLGLGIVAGGICLLVALYGLNILPVNYAGLGLLLLGVVLMGLDLFVPSYGVLTLGGLFSFVLGSVMLFDTAAFAVSPGVIAGVALATIGFFVAAGYLVATSWGKPVEIGDDSIVSRTGVARSELDPEGKVYVWGEYWTAVSESGENVAEGTEIEVVDQERNKLFVKPLSEERSEA